MSEHCMIDLETLGSGSFACILSLGACKFDPNGDKIDDRFEVHIDPESCQKIGMRIDAPTVMWWLAPQRDAARMKLMQAADSRLPIHDALDGFAQWYGRASLPTWGNGSDFDNVIMTNAYKLAGMEVPWMFWDNRCFRTLKNLHPTIEPAFVGEKHSAVDDAEHQVRWLRRIVKDLGLKL